MGLTFVDDSDDTVNVPAASSIDDLAVFTHIQWLYPVDQSSSRLWAKENSDTNNSLITTSATPAELQLDVATSGTALIYLTNDGPLADRVWQCIATTYDEGATPKAHLYKGTLTTRCVELTSFVTKTEGTGTKIADATFALTIGNRRLGSGLRAFGGEIAIHHMEGRVMTLAEIIAWQFRPRNLTDTRLHAHLGFNGLTNVPDLSGNGNVGAISGPSIAVGSHVPLGPFWGGGLSGGGAGDPPAPIYAQSSFRLRNDDGHLRSPP